MIIFLPFFKVCSRLHFPCDLDWLYHSILISLLALKIYSRLLNLTGGRASVSARLPSVLGHPAVPRARARDQSSKTVTLLFVPFLFASALTKYTFAYASQ